MDTVVHNPRLSSSSVYFLKLGLNENEEQRNLDGDYFADARFCVSKKYGLVSNNSFNLENTGTLSPEVLWVLLAAKYPKDGKWFEIIDRDVPIEAVKMTCSSEKNAKLLKVLLEDRSDIVVCDGETIAKHIDAVQKKTGRISKLLAFA